ncbi:hypothetical protein [Roseinatronobacter sp.]|uniref:hypothetical protein n=2 Tax=Roseinatronobacter sp. TaxID=1945755 RepID=UPI003F6E52D5
MGEFLADNALELIQALAAVSAAALAFWSILTARKIAQDSHKFSIENQLMIDASEQRRAHAATIGALDEAIHSLNVHAVRLKTRVRELHRRHDNMGKPETVTSISIARVEAVEDCNELGRKLQAEKEESIQKSINDVGDWKVEEIKALDRIRDVRFVSERHIMMIEDIENELNYLQSRE